MIRLFISYSSNDSAFADKLATDLGSMGINVFYAKWQIKVGESIVEKINEALISHDHLIIILSSSSVVSDWVKRELNSSLMRQLSKKDIKIKPVLLENCEIPPLLVDIKYADFRNDYNCGFYDLINSFQNEIKLEAYLKVVERVGKKVPLSYEYRFLAILLMKHSSFSVIGVRILSYISEKESVTKMDILNEVGTDDLVQHQIEFLKEEMFIDVINRDFFAISPLGSQFLKIFSRAVSEGIVSPVCPL